MKLTKKLLIIAALVMALGYPLNAVTLSACTDDCWADYVAQRNACANLGTWEEVVQCYNDAKEARDLCLASCP